MSKQIQFQANGLVRAVFGVVDLDGCREFYEETLVLVVELEWDHRPEHTGHGYRGAVYPLGVFTGRQ